MCKKYYTLVLLLFIAISASYSQAPVVDFSQNSVTGCGMLVVSFKDLSTGTPTSWLWNFGDGFTSTMKDPTHAYTAPGVYTVKLTATNGSGSNSKTINNLITVFARPTVSFYALSDTIGCQPFATAFTPQTTGPAPMIQYTWDFGDGKSSSVALGEHVYTTPGLYSVSLTVRDANQCTGVKTKTSYIRVKPKPNAVYSAAPLFACAPPLMVAFNNASTGTGLTYSWDFGDGTPKSTDAAPSHNYTSNGKFTPILIVQNNVGCLDTMTIPDYVDLTGFNTGFSANNTQGCTPFSTMFTASSGAEVNYVWDFGDGSASKQGEQVWHDYLSAGNYDVTLIATNGSGCVDTLAIPNYIQLTSGPNITFVASDTVSCKYPFLVNFTNTTPNVQSCSWNFGDGATATGNTPSHTYISGGKFDVTLTLTDNLGCTNHLTKTEYINVDLPVAKIDADVKKGCVPLTVNFSDISTSSPAATSWKWDFGDGQTSTLRNPTHVYADTGHFNVSLIITNSQGCSDTLLSSNFIRVGVKPTAAFVGDSLFGCHPLKTQFTDLSTGFANEWHWYFVNDGESTEQNPMHTFQDTLHVDVALVVSYNGCQDSLMKKDYVYVRFPKPQFTSPNPTGCGAPHMVFFTNTSQGATDYLWRFGDGTTSTDKHPQHTYNLPGTYSVELRVFNDTNMCADSTMNTALIKISNLQAGFISQPSQICQNDSVYFYDTSSVVYPIVAWKWDFGNGYLDLTSGDTTACQYTLGGSYNVKLRVTDSIGCVRDVTVNNAVFVNTLPSPRFSADKRQGCPPFTAQFSDISDSTMVSWLWDFGDGNTSTQKNPQHTYADTGSYTVRLSATDIRGCDSTYEIPNYIRLSYPTPQFAFDSLVCSSDSVCFTNLSIGTNPTYSWDFGDGSPSDTLSDVTHPFSVDTTSILPITLTVTDEYGCSKSLQKNITVSKPVAFFSALSRTSDCPPFNGLFEDASSPDAVSWKWDFGDTISANNNNSYFQDPQHIYINSGLFDVSLTVTNDIGCSDTTQIDDYIFVDGPRGTFDFYPKTGCAPLTVTFVAKAENTADYFWVFGDGASAAGDSVTWTFTDGGFYLPVLVLKDSLKTLMGDTAICMITIVSDDTVRVIDGIADFTLTDSLYCINQNVTFTDISTGIGTVNRWLWDFGDGDTSTVQNPTHAFTTANRFEVKLTAWIDSCPQTIVHWVNVFPFPDIAVIISDTIGCSPFETDFFVDSQTITTPVSSWSWDFGDGSQSAPYQNTNHQYAQSGLYNPRLTVVFNNSCTNSYVYPVNIVVFPSPSADFTYDANFVYPNVPIHFTDISTGDVFSRLWNFGDGSTSGIANPSHSYPSTGYHHISLVVTSSNGCQDSVHYILATTEGIKIPNVFTPNKDGVNDFFYIETYGEFEYANTKIFNRWGTVIWESNSPAVYWDGRTVKGEECPEGTYFYIYNAKSASGKEYESSGSVTLLR